MESVLRAALIYLFLLTVVRITGRRMLADMTTFDFVLLLIISEATQQGLLGDDFSVINAWIVIATLCTIEMVLAYVKSRFPSVAGWVDGRPVVVVRNGQLLETPMKAEGVDREDILSAARHLRGLEDLGQVRHAIVEESGGISIVPAGLGRGGSEDPPEARVEKADKRPV